MYSRFCNIIIYQTLLFSLLKVKLATKEILINLLIHVINTYFEIKYLFVPFVMRYIFALLPKVYNYCNIKILICFVFTTKKMCEPNLPS